MYCSIGSDDEEDGQVEVAGESKPPPPLASPKDTPTPTGLPSTGAAEAEPEGGGVTPPTPIAVMVTLADSTEPVPIDTLDPPPAEENGKSEGETASPPQDGNDGSVSIEQVSAISKEEGTEVDHQATSPPAVSPQETGPQIKTLTEVQ